MNSTSLQLDDRDPTIQFNGNWAKGGTPNEYLGTVSSSTNVGDSFVVPFHGISIVVYGTVDLNSGGVTTNYSIDGQSAEQVISKRSVGGGDEYHQEFWTSPSLNVSQHQLTVTMVKVNPDSDPQYNEGTIWFDYFVVSSPSPSEGGGNTGGGTGSQGGGGTGSGDTNTGGGNTGGSAGGQQRVTPKLSKGEIAGCAVGGLILIGIVLCGILWLRRRRARKEADAQQWSRESHHQGYGKEVHWDSGQPLRAQAQQPTELRNNIWQQSIFHAPTPNPVTVSSSHPLWLQEGQSGSISTRGTSPPTGLQIYEPPPVLSFPLGVSTGPRSSVEQQENIMALSNTKVQPPLSPNEIKNGIGSWSSDIGTQLIWDATQRPMDHSVASPPRQSSDLTSAATPRGGNARRSSAVTVTTAGEGSQVQGSHEDSGKGGKMTTSQVSYGGVTVRDQGMVAVRHIDSGIRLGAEEAGRPEFPPVYSPT